MQQQADNVDALERKLKEFRDELKTVETEKYVSNRKVNFFLKGSRWTLSDCKSVWERSERESYDN